MKKIFGLMAFAFLIFNTSSAFAWFSCSGSVQVNITTDGVITLRSDEAFQDGNSRQICSLNSEWKGVSPVTCKALFSEMLAAQSTNKKIWLQYLDDSSICKTISTPPYSMHIE